MSNQPIQRLSNHVCLPIHREWFDMILAGVKKEEYRALTDYWAVRLLSELDLFTFRNYDDPRWPDGHLGHLMSITKLYPKHPGGALLLTNGYNPKRDRQMLVEWVGIEAKEPNPLWSPPGTKGVWFANKLGKILQTSNC